ncbi:MAG: phosphoadenylyl-sulfate reductase [Bryobacteraceae bacterium]
MSFPSQLESAPAADLLRWAVATYGRNFAISTSFQAEGMILIDITAKIGLPFRVITLDTGRLPEETHRMIETVRERYGVAVEAVLPDRAEVESMVERYGSNLFYREPALRNLCCHIRKVRPLERKLRELRAYAVGLRRSQSETRTAVAKAEQINGVWKLSPLADWTREQVDEYTRRNDVPLHPLYARGYTSIGCAPCTRAVEAGEDERAGRWWWELDSSKECGLHFSPSGKLERRFDVLLREILESKDA